jgi:hypothetical protein
MVILHPNTSCFFYKNVLKLMQNSYSKIHVYLLPLSVTFFVFIIYYKNNDIHIKSCWDRNKNTLLIRYNRTWKVHIKNIFLDIFNKCFSMVILHPNTSCFFYKNVLKLMQNSYSEIHVYLLPLLFSKSNIFPIFFRIFT